MRKKQPLTAYLSNSIFYLVLKKKTGKKRVLLGKTITAGATNRKGISAPLHEVGKAR